MLTHGSLRQTLERHGRDSGRRRGCPDRPSLAALRKLEDQLDAAWPERTKVNGGNVSDASSEKDRGVLNVPESPASLGPRLAELRAAVQGDGHVVETAIVTPSFWGPPRVTVPTLLIWTADRGTDASPRNLSPQPANQGWESYVGRSLVLHPDADIGLGEAGSVPSKAALADPFVELQAVAGRYQGQLAGGGEDERA